MQQENDETYDKLHREVCSSVVETNYLETEVWSDSERCGFGNCTVSMFPDNTIHENMSSIHNKRRQVFDIVHKSYRDYTKNL